MSLNINEMIGEHFKLKHLIYSSTAGLYNINNIPGIDNNPSQTEVIENLRELMINVVDKVINKWPTLIIKSAYRCLALNAKMGGSPTSQHIFGQAVDLQVPGVRSAEVYNYIYYNVGVWDQLIWKFPEKGPESWVYVSYTINKPRIKTTLASDIPKNHKIYNKKESTEQHTHNLGPIKLL
jgi:zinc D-Ala-D-Ala carboxypeptidase